MKKLISVRLEEEDYKKLMVEAKPLGGVGKWIVANLYLFGNTPPVEKSEIETPVIIKTKEDALRKLESVKLVSNRNGFRFCEKHGVMTNMCDCK